MRNGQVLVAGGHAGQISHNTAEMYDPATGIWRQTASFNTINVSGSAVLLPSGKVLVVGLSSSNSMGAELYDSATETWSSTNAPSFMGPLVVLPNGKVLSVDWGNPWGYDGLYAETYDPSTGQWSSTDAPNFMTFLQTMTPLRDGKVLVTGEAGLGPVRAELYDANTQTWTITGNLNKVVFYDHIATQQSDGRVLVTGGFDHFSTNLSREEQLYEPTVGTWTTTSRLIVARESHTATLLQNGKTLVAGGLASSVNCNSLILRSAELYNPDTIPISNPIDDPQFFVRQHYLDFLNREPDSAGLDFWTNEITACGTDQQCIEIKRINVSAAFFLSIEFQETGYLVYRMYKAAYGDMPGAPVPLTRQDFLPDAQWLGHGFVVGAPGWEQALENNKSGFANEFASRSRFISSFPEGMTPQLFVDTLNTNAGGVLSSTERDQLVSELTAGVKTRPQVLRSIAEDADLARNEFNKAFVLMQYFGYLRRNPHDAPDSNFNGYNFWLSKLDSFGGDFVSAEMVKAFITSIEYRNRFDGCAGCWDY
jgi:hypothetical protein